MRALWFVALFAGLGASFSSGQQTSPSASAPVADAKPAHVKVYAVGPGVTAPILLHDAVPYYSVEARRAKYQGVCILSLVVDAKGKPQDVRVVRALGMGLDEKAIEAVSQYRFKPAMKNGMPVPVKINIEVAFRLY